MICLFSGLCPLYLYKKKSWAYVFAHRDVPSPLTHKLKVSVVPLCQVSERHSIKTTIHQEAGKAPYLSYSIPARSTRDRVLVRVFQRNRTNMIYRKRFFMRVGSYDYGGSPMICCLHAGSPGRPVVGFQGKPKGLATREANFKFQSGSEG